MPDYRIDPRNHPADACAFCGEEDDLVNMHIRNESRGGTTTLVGCRGCNSSMGAKTLKEWLRRQRDKETERWEEILYRHKGRRTDLARLIRDIRDEQ